MKAPNLPVLRLSSPAPQVGQERGLEPSPRSGNRCGASASLIFSITSEMRSSFVSSTAPVKSRQKSRSSCFQSARPPETSSSSSSSSAVKSYSTYFGK